jgi:D-glucosaminate-6-phosphate ammonia-lyase
MNDTSTTASTTARNANPYLALGVRPFINCASVRTAHSGSLMLPEVKAAMAEASRQFVNLDELMEAAGRRIAELTGAPLGIVTCGSAAALTLATAACVAGNDPVKMVRLPFTDGWTNRVIMLKNQRFAYDQAIRMVGTHIVEIDSIAELEAALAEPVAMVAILGTHEASSTVRLEDIVSRTLPLGIPILVDAASEHIERPSPYLARGADMVIYSGGKFLRGPQTSGLLLGRKDLIQAAWRNASPHQAFARGMKVSKEDIVGLLAALEVWFEHRDPAVELARWNDDLVRVAGWLREPHIDCKIIAPHGVVLVPRLSVSWNRSHWPVDGETLRLRLLAGEPRIMLDDMAVGENSIAIDPFGLQPGEADQVGKAVLAGLTVQAEAAQPSVSVARAALSGRWDLEVSFLYGKRLMTIELQDADGAVTGTHTSPRFEGAVTGHVDSAGIHLVFTTWHEGTMVAYRLDGSIADGRMQGDVTLGSATQNRRGPINLAQFGPGSFQGLRIAAP